ncbi:MAG: DedD protein [Porticoccus sp.]|jgi:DedD protein
MRGAVKSKIMYTVALSALAVIFVPLLIESLMSKEVDETSVIPVNSSISPLVSMPIRPKNIISAKSDEKIFQPQSRSGQLDDSLDDKTPSLSHEGIPLAWVLQVGSFAEKKSAMALSEKLLADGYKSFIRDLKGSKNTASRVFVGPKIIKQTLINDKAVLDKKYGFDSHLMYFGP